MAQRIQAENQLSRAIMNLQAVAEAYPQLQANQNFLDLQAQLKALEEKIAYARQFYNDVVQKYNTKIEVVPTNIIAGLFHFEQAGLLPDRRSGPSGSASQVLSVPYSISIQEKGSADGVRCLASTPFLVLRSVDVETMRWLLEDP